MPATSEDAARMASEMGWFDGLSEDGMPKSFVTQENAWKVSVAAGAFYRRVKWSVASLGQFKFPATPEGAPSIVLVAEIGGLTHVLNEQVGSDGQDIIHILRRSTSNDELHSVGYISNWPENWQRN